MAGKIKEFGMPVPICVRPDGSIVDGHLRYKACKKLNLAQVPVAVNETWSPTKIKAYRLSVNQASEMAEWDTEFQALELQELKDEGYDLDHIGFSDEVLDNLLNSMNENVEGLCDEDDIPEIKEDPISKIGDTWILGNHRLMCGDSVNIQNVEKLLVGNSIDMIFTDPPYGMSAVSKSGVLTKTYKYDILNDDNTDVAKDTYRLCSNIGIPKLIFWGANYYSSALPDSSAWLVWDKNNGNSDQMDAELAWTNLKGVTRKFTKSSEKINRVHPNQKPVELITWVFEKYDAGNILDLFGGSGSTLISCEKTNRKCFMMELSPQYCDVIIKRWQKFTGKKAYLESTGIFFDEMNAP